MSLLERRRVIRSIVQNELFRRHIYCLPAREQRTGSPLEFCVKFGVVRLEVLVLLQLPCIPLYRLLWDVLGTDFEPHVLQVLRKLIVFTAVRVVKVIVR